MSTRLEQVPVPSDPRRRQTAGGQRAQCPCGRIVRVRGHLNRYWRHREWQNGSGAATTWCKWSNTPAPAHKLFTLNTD